jgi:tRNA pseudouridine38-40 synthase
MLRSRVGVVGSRHGIGDTTARVTVEVGRTVLAVMVPPYNNTDDRRLSNDRAPRGRSSLEWRVPRFKLTIEYAGTRYSGWQIQKNARTVQGEIDRAVRSVTGRKDFELYGSGRTDAGVHARAQVAHLDVSTTLPPDTLVGRLNDELPADIHLLSAAVVPHRFHARHDASGRRYLYQIARRRTAFAKPFVWWVKEPLDPELMRHAARAFVGMRDFQSFADEDAGEGDARQGASRLVLIERLDIADDEDLILIGVEGSHFLWKMVRRIVGVLVEIGRGRLEPSAAAGFLAAPSPVPARLTAPASGLFLDRVWYQGDARDEALRPVTPLMRLTQAGSSRTPSTRRTTSA